ncbi:DUF4837 family protein [Flavobacterium azooxidireducens]|uniref:DUF4837 family protein n=1 Tax=Flavobacterium azooxidireducens TaxID=1871076 RepID=A0ABY4KM34_9FLAO|nr:DUF4837 family protein [Flavobacterium azooxidireducens]UPQ80470.1 DUF4837 family protein [Flavobacterium azooxidireducens]
MKKVVILLFAVSFFFSCKEENREDLLKESSGKINHLSVIIENQLWNGEVGDSIRTIFAAPVDGLPQEEPLFTIKQYAPNLFEGFMTNSRNILVVLKKENNDFELVENEFAKPQNVAHITGSSVAEIVSLLEKHSPEIINKFKQTDIAENQRRISKSLLDDAKIKKNFKASLKLPTAYKYIIEEDKFFWIRKELPSGNASILIYEVPLNRIQKDTNTIANIIQMRDSIGQKHIEGTLPNTYMITEASYSPYLFNIILNGKKTYETKGTWELKNDYMAGPFINYAIRDEKNNRYLVIEGFCYNPSLAKRDIMHELESILKSVKIL